MFGLQKYLNKIYNVKWFFLPCDLKKLEEMFFVSFKEERNYYMIDEIHYSYIDILLALENMDFELLKCGEDVKIKILKLSI